MVDLRGWAPGQIRRGDISDVGIIGLLYEVVCVERDQTVRVKALHEHRSDDGVAYEKGQEWWVFEESIQTSVLVRDPTIEEESLLLAAFTAAVANLLGEGV